MLDSLVNVIKRLHEISEANQLAVKVENCNTQEETNPIEAYRKALNNKQKNECKETPQASKQNLKINSEKLASMASNISPDVRNILAQQAIIALTKDILSNNYRVEKCTKNNKVTTTIILDDTPVMEYTSTEGKLLSIDIDLVPKDYELIEVALEKMQYIGRKIDKALDVRNLKNK